MPKNTQINLLATQKIAKALGDLNESVVFVGGAVISWYIDDPAAEDVRPTKDIDLTFDIASYSKLELLRQSLEQRGFTQSHEDDVICRFRYQELIIDVMSTTAVGWAPSNPWFGPGFEQAVTFKIDTHFIRIMPLPYFFASK